MNAPLSLLPAVALLALSLGGCAGSVASYPSLAPRAIEQADGASSAAAAATTALAPAITARAAALLTEARRGAAAVEAAERSGCAAIGRGYGAAEGSEAWVAAQQALSAIEAERQLTASALDDLDGLVLEQARLAQDAATPVDLTPLTDAAREVQTLDAAQRTRLTELREKGCQR